MMIYDDDDIWYDDDGDDDDDNDDDDDKMCGDVMCQIAGLLLWAVILEIL